MDPSVVRGLLLGIANPFALAIVWGCAAGAVLGAVGLRGLFRQDLREARVFAALHGAAAGGAIGVILSILHMLQKLSTASIAVDATRTIGPALHALAAAAVVSGTLRTTNGRERGPFGDLSDTGSPWIGLAIALLAFAAFGFVSGFHPGAMVQPLPMVIVGSGVLFPLVAYEAFGSRTRPPSEHAAIFWMLLAATSSISGIAGGLVGLAHVVAAANDMPSVGSGIAVAYISLVYGVIGAAVGGVLATGEARRASGEAAGAVAGMSLLATVAVASVAVVAAYAALVPVFTSPKVP